MQYRTSAAAAAADRRAVDSTDAAGDADSVVVVSVTAAGLRWVETTHVRIQAPHSAALVTGNNKTGDQTEQTCDVQNHGKFEYIHTFTKRQQDGIKNRHLKLVVAGHCHYRKCLSNIPHGYIYS